MKKYYVCWIWLFLACLSSGTVFAQLSISSPVARMVVQRNLYNEANILVAGLAPANATAVEARLVPLALGQGQLTAWTSLPFLATTKAFRGPLLATGGWYRLEVRARNGGTLLTQTSVDRVGVGEVFVIAGQSNAVGGFEREPGADEDRVSCVDFRQDALDEQLLPLRFSHVSYGSSIGPSHPPHIWGMLGDMLVRRLNVPVLFLGGGQPGTSSDQWRQSAAGSTDAQGRPYPYRRLGVALQHYALRTGVRAILWHQGEGDIGSSNNTYFSNLQYVIQKTRQQVGFNQLPWLMSRVSYTQGQTNPNVIAAQNRLIAEVNNVYPGPSTDDMIGPDNRLGDDVHIGGNGLRRFADRWNQALTDDFFYQTAPFTPTDESALLTSSYTLPLTRRPGETVLAPSLRADPNDASSQYFAQLLRASDNSLVTESARTTANPIPLTLPGNLPDGQYRLRTLSTLPGAAGTLSEPFTVNFFAPSFSPPTPTAPNVRGGTPDPAIRRMGYRYEAVVPAFWFMAEATTAVQCRIERIDGGSFSDTGWYTVPPSSQGPDYTDFADYNYLRNYPPITFGVGGVPPGRYRISVRKQGDSGAGMWIETTLQEGRNTLFIGNEPVSNIPTVITPTVLSPAVPCRGNAFTVAFDLTESPVNSGNVFSVKLSDADGSFADETTIGTGTSSPLTATLPASLPGSNYRIRIVASNPAVASAPLPIDLCTPLADLSLALSVSTRTPRIEQPVTVTAAVTNTGPFAGAGIVVASMLPTGLSFVDAGSAEVSVANNTVTINTGSLNSGSTRRYTFRLKPTQPGRFITTAQLTASTITDPDSQPNSGTGDGQDDTAQLDLRTPDSSTAVYVSPNPNQTPLPAVQSNQPPTDPAKADLSLLMASSTLTPKSGQAFSLSITVGNRGGTIASVATVQIQLPTGWQLTNNAGLVVSGQTVTATLNNILINSANTVVLSVQANTSGTVRSQIQTSTQADPDSVPGNGYQTGEDDEASLNLRTQ
ncbi:sialate O-acetylesterase [Spirosoma sp. 209]|uniref:sialate O-acetylesterase n=1 Tax=Spirosoma sp. 209 TaxID=1955701 RepID=UPI00098D5AD8|nr:sialate O-acetylesterase [Spirosoma sp. 209]